MQEFAYTPGETKRKATTQMAKKPVRKPSRVKTRYTNHIKVFLCYLIAWSLAAFLPLAGLLWVYPYKLVGTAPAVLEHLAAAIPQLESLLARGMGEAALAEGMTSSALSQTLAVRDFQWRLVVGALVALLWLVSLIMQLSWRNRYRHPVGIARAARRAVRTYRLMWLWILLLNGAGALALYGIGVQFIVGRTLWDWLVYFGGFGLCPLAAFVCFRLAAPPAISGKHAFFKRL